MLIALTDFEGHARTAARFELGHLVRHRQSLYRAVVVACDSCCLAGDTWYFSNKTQPPRDQPWYHLLVDGSGGLSTYVAQSELEADTAGQPIHHPRVQVYFSRFEAGRYILREDYTGGCCGI